MSPAGSILTLTVIVVSVYVGTAAHAVSVGVAAVALTSWLGASAAGFAGSLDTDRVALMGVFNATGGAHWRKQKNWGTSESVCEWHGVSCDEKRTRVVSLYVLRSARTTCLL